MNMKVKKLVLALAAVCVSISISAQPAKSQGIRKNACKMTVEQRMDMKTKAMVSKLMLNDSEKSKFIKTYKSFLLDLRKTTPSDCCRVSVNRNSCKSQGTCKKGTAKKCANKTDAEINKMIENRLTMKQARLDISKKYFKKFSAFLTPKQVAYVLKSTSKKCSSNSKMKGNRCGEKTKSCRGMKK